MELNGWKKLGGASLIGIIVGVGGAWLTRHDVGVAGSATQAVDIQELKEFKSRIERNVEEWRGDQSDFKRRLQTLEDESHLARRERAEMLRWMERASAKLNLIPPNQSQSSIKRLEPINGQIGRNP